MGASEDNVLNSSIDSYWAMFKGKKGIYLKMSSITLLRYVGEFIGGDKQRKANTTDQITDLVLSMNNKQLTCKEFIQ